MRMRRWRLPGSAREGSSYFVTSRRPRAAALGTGKDVLQESAPPSGAVRGAVVAAAELTFRVEDAAIGVDVEQEQGSFAVHAKIAARVAAARESAKKRADDAAQPLCEI